jgi:glucokinase
VSEWALAVDVGGTKLAAARVTADGQLRVRAQCPTPQTDDAEEIWSALLGLIADVVAGEPVAAVGVGCGGPMRWPEGDVSPLNITAWRDFPLRRRLQEELPEAAVRVHNDAVAMAVGEHWVGAGNGVRDFLGIVVSTGVGGGLISGGALVHGRSGNQRKTRPVKW